MVEDARSVAFPCVVESVQCAEGDYFLRFFGVVLSFRTHDVVADVAFALVDCFLVFVFPCCVGFPFHDDQIARVAFLADDDCHSYVVVCFVVHVAFPADVRHSYVVVCFVVRVAFLVDDDHFPFDFGFAFPDHVAFDVVHE